MSAISVMTQRQKDFLQIFESKEHTKAGVYSVNFWKNGERVNVLIDSQFPATKQDQAAFGHSAKENELWVMILEKAYGQWSRAAVCSSSRELLTDSYRVFERALTSLSLCVIVACAQPKFTATTSLSRPASWTRRWWI